MNTKQSIVIVAAMTLSMGVNAQTLQDGVKMYKYERYESAKKILAPMAAGNPEANYYLGLSEIGLENNEAARTIFNKYPEDAANMAGLARVAYETKNVAEGNRLATAVADKAKKKEWLPLKYAADAINYSDGGNIQQAIDWYKKALERNDNPDLRISLGDAYQKIQGGGGEAMNNYENVTTKDPKNSLAFSRIGALWYAAKNYKLALENYQKAKDADPENPLPYRDLANAYFWVNNFDLALQNIEKYWELSDKSIQDEIQYMNILYKAKKYGPAIERANQLLQKGVRKPGVYGILGYSYLETKDSAKALENARIYFSIQDPKRIFPADYQILAKIMLANGMEDSADFYFEKAVQMDTASDKSQTFRGNAEAFKDAKRYAKSAKWYERLTTTYPSTPAIDYFWAGAMYYYAKNYASAATLFQTMETKYPDQPSATYWRGRVAAAQDEEGKTCAAAVFYESWLAKVGPNYEKKNDQMYAYQYLALCYYNKGDTTKAKEYLDLIEKIDPANSFLKQMRDLLNKKK
jgi:tetratricopeptide (TPR) repeat protein